MRAAWSAPPRHVGRLNCLTRRAHERPQLDAVAGRVRFDAIELSFAAAGFARWARQEFCGREKDFYHSKEYPIREESQYRLNNTETVSYLCFGLLAII